MARCRSSRSIGVENASLSSVRFLTLMRSPFVLGVNDPLGDFRAARPHVFDQQAGGDADIGALFGEQGEKVRDLEIPARRPACREISCCCLCLLRRSFLSLSDKEINQCECKNCNQLRNRGW